MSTAKEVVVAALTQPLPDRPGDETARVADRADLIVAALVEHGHLPGPETPPVTEADVVEAAKWLAEECRHPRYAGDGWKKLLQSEADVMVAMNSAAVYGPVTDNRKAVAGMLLFWQKEHPYDHAKGVNV